MRLTLDGAPLPIAAFVLYIHESNMVWLYFLRLLPKTFLQNRKVEYAKKQGDAGKREIGVYQRMVQA